VVITEPAFSMAPHSLHLERLAPAPAHMHSSFDLHQFAYRPNSPVHANAAAEGEWTSPGIAFEDYARMSTQTKKQSGCRRLDTPEWALDQTKLRALIVLLFEGRAFGRAKKYRAVVGVGTERERLRRAQSKMFADRPKKLAILDGLCIEYVTLKREGGDPARVRKLESIIEGLDTSIRMIDEGPGMVLRIVQLYYSVRLDSVGVGAEVGIRPPHVRQTLHRMARVWDELKGRCPQLPTLLK
jgi:hypothetical protein